MAAASSILQCLSSVALFSSFSASAGGFVPSTITSSSSPEAHCHLNIHRSTNDRRPTSKPSSLLSFREVLSSSSNRRPSHVLSGDNIIHTGQATESVTAPQQNEPLLIEDAAFNRGEGSSFSSCRVCGRRGLLASMGGGLLASNGSTRTATAASFQASDYNAIREALHPARPEWYEEFYAQSMAKTMVSYEAEVADYKCQLFGELDDKVEHIMELGIGTGPNMKYYRNLPHLQQVVGVDPNLQMAKYCADSAIAAGLSDSQFEFLHSVGEGIPVPDESMDVVVCTLTLCSVSDVTKTLEEIKRVLKPGGTFLFVEHVAAQEGSGLRFVQGLLDPLQQWIADGCHLTRDTLGFIEGAHFGSVQSERFNVASVSLISPHVGGVAYKSQQQTTK